MPQQVKLYLTLAFLKDAETGDFTAYYVQFPDASAQGRTKKEAKKLLNEIFPYLLKEKKDEFIKYHKDEPPRCITFEDRQMTVSNA
jgi:predicted RNase H-like HicB family nuclease